MIASEIIDSGLLKNNDPPVFAAIELYLNDTT